MSDGNVLPFDTRMKQFEQLTPDEQKLLLERANNTRYGSNGGGGNSGIEIRVSRLEEDVKEIKFDLKSMKTDIHGVKSDFAVIKNDISNIKQTMVSKADLAAEMKTLESNLQRKMVAEADVTAKVKSSELNLIKWIVSTMLASAGLAVVIAKLI